MADRIDRLRALTGEQEVYDNSFTEETQPEVEDAFVLPEGYKISSARNIYDGTSEEDNTPVPAQAKKLGKSKQRSNDSQQQRQGDSGNRPSARIQAGMNQHQYGSSAPLL